MSQYTITACDQCGREIPSEDRIYAFITDPKKGNFQMVISGEPMIGDHLSINDFCSIDCILLVVKQFLGGRKPMSRGNTNARSI